MSGTTLPLAAVAALRARLRGVDLTRAVYLDRGYHATAYRAGSWVLRVPRTVVARTRIAEQTRVYEILSARGLPVPRDAGVARDAGGEVVAGFYRYIAGDPASVSRRGPGLVRDIAEFLTRLHAVPLDVLGDLGEPVDDPWAGRFRALWDRSRPHLPPDDRDWLEDVIARFLASPPGPSPRRVLIHGDLGEEHVLVDRDGRLAGVIDPRGPRLTDPAVDFGSLGERCGWAFAEAVLAAYAGARDPGFARRARFWACVGPLATIEVGVRQRDLERLRLGLHRLSERRAEACEPR